jgi:hypothetical protein
MAPKKYIEMMMIAFYEQQFFGTKPSIQSEVEFLTA